MLLMIKWVCYSCLVLCILPLALEHPGRYIGASFFAVLAIVFAKAEGLELGKTSDEGDDDE